MWCHKSMPVVSTFSVVAYDPATESWGVAVQSRFLAVGSIVPWAQAGVGAVATQALVNPRFGPLALAMLHQGLSAEEVVGGLVGGDPGRETRQVGVIDRHGQAAAFTGTQCFPWAGHVVGPHFCCQGNILAAEEVVAVMAEAMRRQSDQPFVDRLMAALQAGQAAGGDSRGQQAAALLVVRAGAGFGGYSDRAVDLRVDDHPAPVTELVRLVGLHREMYGT